MTLRIRTKANGALIMRQASAVRWQWCRNSIIKWNLAYPVSPSSSTSSTGHSLLHSPYSWTTIGIKNRQIFRHRIKTREQALNNIRNSTWMRMMTMMMEKMRTSKTSLKAVKVLKKFLATSASKHQQIQRHFSNSNSIIMMISRIGIITATKHNIMTERVGITNKTGTIQTTKTHGTISNTEDTIEIRKRSISE